MQNCYMQNLNDSQIIPVKQTDGAVLVIAGAGSGKTRVLTNRIAYLVNELNVSPSRILAITFTNKAADEMRSRLTQMVDNVDSMWICTIHSMCVKILRSCISKIGFEQNFSIYSEDDKERVLKRIISEMGLDGEKFLKRSKNLISSAKNDDLSPREFKEEYITLSDVGFIAEIYQKYEDELKNSNALDFDDLLIKTLHLLLEHDDVAEYYADKFKYVHIDEFQDTNTVQYKIAKILSSVHNNIFAVGDDDQSIYGWRGAKIENILNFEKDFKDAQVYKLEQNYRSTKNILKIANHIIKNNSERKDKTLWTDNCEGDKAELYVASEELDEAQYVAMKIKSLINKGEKASNFAVLMRINALSRAFEQEFLKYNIPYKVFGGFKFYDRKEIKDLTAYLRIISNPFDNEAVLRIINVPRRGIGDKTVEEIKRVANLKDLHVFEVIMDAENLPLASSSISKIKQFKDLLYNLIMQSQDKSVEQVLKNVIEKTAFMSQFEISNDENEDKKMNVNELVNSAIEYDKQNPNANLSDYLSSITLSSDVDEMDASNYVTVATIHAVKGLEFDTVFAVGLDETVFPVSRATSSDSDMEEERRLMYVAITRAKKNLYVTRARSRFLYGNRTYTLESRFLKEIKPLLSSYGEQNSYRTQAGASYNGGYKGYGNSYKNSDGDDFGYYADVPSTPSVSTKSFSTGYILNKPKTLTNASVGSSKFSVGTKVVHKKFGKGTVIAVKENGKFIDVAFANLGIKTLASEIAPIEIEK